MVQSNGPFFDAQKQGYDACAKQVRGRTLRILVQQLHSIVIVFVDVIRCDLVRHLGSSRRHFGALSVTPVGGKGSFVRIMIKMKERLRRTEGSTCKPFVIATTKACRRQQARKGMAGAGVPRPNRRASARQIV